MGTQTDPVAPTNGVALTMLGGGFRATLFHLGVVRCLREKGILQNVTHITSVSGGSILAAHLVLNWERYTGTEEQFDAAIQELIAFIQWDLRGHVVRPWLASIVALNMPNLFARGQWKRTALLQSAYNRLYYSDPTTKKKPATLKDLTEKLADGRNRPELYILATNMTTGHLAAFGSNQYAIDVNPITIPAHNIPVSLAVAASSAFPPLFPPIRVDHDTFKVNEQEDFPHAHYLADGGVFDNLGIRKLLWITKGHVKFERVIVSDAQRLFTEDYKSKYFFLISRAGRSVDLLMDRVSKFENEAIDTLRGNNSCIVSACRLQHDIPDTFANALPSNVQKSVQNIRTDLDRFTDHEVNAVVRQGMTICRFALSDEQTTTGETTHLHESTSQVWQPIRGVKPDDLAADIQTRWKATAIGNRSCCAQHWSR